MDCLEPLHQASAKGINWRVTSYSLNDERTEGEAWEGQGIQLCGCLGHSYSMAGGPEAQGLSTGLQTTEF